LVLKAFLFSIYDRSGCGPGQSVARASFSFFFHVPRGERSNRRRPLGGGDASSYSVPNFHGPVVDFLYFSCPTRVKGTVVSGFNRSRCPIYVVSNIWFRNMPLFFRFPPLSFSPPSQICHPQVSGLLPQYSQISLPGVSPLCARLIINIVLLSLSPFHAGPPPPRHRRFSMAISYTM